MEEVQRKRGHRVSPLRIVDIRSIAGLVRDQLDMPTGSINMQNLLEIVLPQIYPGFHFDVVEKHVLGHDHARTYPQQRLIEIRNDVYDGLCEKQGRDRFTVAHEIGHLFLHKAPVLARGSQDHKIFEDSEWQADRFAAEFLMPYDDCRTCKSYQQIMVRFGVSPTAAQKRFREMMQK